MLIELLYTSSATDRMDENALVALLEISRRNNEVNDISGLLVYHEGTFVQVLEGEDEAVMRLYQRILQDPRHKGTRVLWKLPIETRAFGDWAMAFRELSDVDPARLAGYSQFLEDGFAGNAAGGDSSKAMTLMRLVGDVP